MKKILLLIAVALTLTLVFMACTTDTEEATTTPEETQEPVPSVVERYLIFSEECQAAFGPQTTARFKEVFEATWLEISYYFARGGRPFQVTLRAASESEGPNAPGWASGTTTWIRPSWMRNNPNDIDILVHEIAHNAQQYGGNTAFWIVEGIAEYVRDRWGMFNHLQPWSLPSRPPGNATYADPGHRPAGGFVRFATEYFYPDFNFAVEVNRRAQQGGLNLNASREWVFEQTGYSLATLWDMYAGRTVAIVYDNQNDAAGDYTIVQNPIFVDGGTGWENTDAANLFDGDADTSFAAVVDSNFWVEWRYETAVVANRFVFSSAGTLTNPRRMGNWRLYGSNDGGDWNEIFLGAVRHTAIAPGRYFAVDINSDEAFRYFRLVSLNGADGQFVQLSSVAIAS